MHPLNRANLRSRYRITGRLVLDTALHIGGGRESSPATDSPVVQTLTGEPFIPGSSFKGAFRAAVERLAPTLGLNTCQLQPEYPDCLSTNTELSQSYTALKDWLGRHPPHNEATHRALTALGVENWMAEMKEDEGWLLTEDRLLEILDVHLCETCKTFGSVHLASVALFHDLPVEDWEDTFQIRDGVGIDRDSERAREGIKYDFEVVPSETSFAFSMTVENPTEQDLGLIAMGLQEFIQGMVALGGIRSRGLGRCHLTDLEVRGVEFENFNELQAYLVDRTLQTRDLADFIRKGMAALLEGEARDA